MLDAFLAHLQHERRVSPHTVANYRRDVESLLLAARPLSVTELDVHALRRLAARFSAQGLGSRSLARRLSAWRSFFRFLAREGVVSRNPALGLRAPRAEKRLPATLSADACGALMNVPGDDFLAVRDRAILELFYSSGLRLSELAGLRLGDVDDEGSVRVTGKGRKTRVVPVGRKAMEALASWYLLRAQRAAPDVAALFVNVRGRPLSPRSIQRRLAFWARKLGLGVHVHPHMLRHSFASHLLQSSGDLRAVQEMLGHANIATTQVYTHLDWQHLARVYDAAHPRARKKP